MCSTAHRLAGLDVKLLGGPFPAFCGSWNPLSGGQLSSRGSLSAVSTPSALCPLKRQFVVSPTPPGDGGEVPEGVSQERVPPATVP